jgi:hypothetical protein
MVLNPMAPKDLEDLLTQAARARRLARATPNDPTGLRLRIRSLRGHAASQLMLPQMAGQAPLWKTPVPTTRQGPVGDTTAGVFPAITKKLTEG